MQERKEMKRCVPISEIAPLPTDWEKSLFVLTETDKRIMRAIREQEAHEEKIAKIFKTRGDN